MFVEALGRQVAVCSLEGAARVVQADKRYWNVISICGPREQKADWRLVRSVHYACFDDVEDESSAVYRSPRAADIADIFAFIRSLGDGPPPPPLLVHCGEGISRSTAVALSWIYGHLPPSGDRLVKAVDLILELRPEAKPNRLVLALGLAQFLAAREARDVAQRMMAEPRIAQNRFRRSEQP
jgi:predicted protein tyrosine phosphatase